ncbi:G-type lectin S-receptor serine/threonine-protein kinase [Trifolium repens]|nr:G-type lectin S-receptor serine/threonine-protein kinase [Trifolium repens]
MKGFSVHTLFLFCLSTSTVFFSISVSSSSSSDTLTTTQILRINETLFSPKGIFQLSFFSYNNFSWYLGIRYNIDHDNNTVVWVANRNTPILNPNSFLKLTDTGNLIIIDQSNKTIWATQKINKNSTFNKNPILQILDSGNLVVSESPNENDPTKFLWQSFDFPTDTLLPGMKLGWNFDTNTETYINSWKVTDQDPSIGDISFKMDYHGVPEIFLWKNNRRIYRSGPWNGKRFSGVPEMQPVTDSIQFSFVQNEHEVYYTFSIGNESLFSRLSVDSFGELQRLTWIHSRKIWTKFWYAPKDQCDNYKECGPFGICDTNASPVCNCIKGFHPKNHQAWNLRDGSDGCLRDNMLDCESDRFLHLVNVKLPETSNVFVNRSMSLLECSDLCKKNCSCTGYANIEIVNGGSGCVMWLDQLIDIRAYPVGGQDLFVRLAASDVEDDVLRKTYDRKTARAIGIMAGGAAIIFLAVGLCFLWRKKKLQFLLNFKGKNEKRGSLEKSQDLLIAEGVFTSNREQSSENNMDDLELPFFDFNTIIMATNNFSEQNKLGQGGFGIVYKGRLMEGQEIAMDEKVLVYEYMENRSLDAILFDKAKRSSLDWQTRFNIISGIARGLLYLHQDSRFRIIHRDLKASNILLDREMNPKISDFGMARIFGTDQTEANTVRVVGTYGYMSPEYAMDGIFSVKSDVFSFGVLVMEIISGKKNRGFYSANKELNLLGHSWKLWKEGNAMKLIDSSIDNSYSPSEVFRCIQVGLLCVQERAEDRPTMSSVVLMLSSETATVAEPKNPGFCLGSNPIETDSSSSKKDESCTVNQVTVTMIDGR